MPDLVGTQFGKYVLLSLLGRGGFAEVYLGRHVVLGTQVAVKVLHTHLSEDEGANFQREAQMIANLIHPHIVRVYDIDEKDGTPYLVMDYCAEGNLRRRHPRGERVPLNKVVSYTKQIAEALQYAHNQRLVHRDVKPENMLIGQNESILLGDFGIAIMAHSTLSMSSQEAVGTIPYMAPEQIQGQARTASDQYALAVVAYEWLSGERPFNGSYTEIFAQHLSVPPPPLRGKVAGLSYEGEQVILRALAKDPKQRFSSVQAFATALEAASLNHPGMHSASTVFASGPLLRAETQKHSPYTPTIPATPPPKQRRRSARRDSANTEVPPYPATEPTPYPGEEEEEVVTPAPQRQRFWGRMPGLKRETRYSPERRKMLAWMAIAGFVVVGGGIGWEVFAPKPLYVYRGHDSHVESVIWSADSKRIASASDDGTVQIWNAFDGGKVVKYKGTTQGSLFGESPVSVNTISWSWDGKYILLTNETSNVYIWNITNGNIQEIDPNTTAAPTVTWSPNSSRFFLTHGLEDAGIWENNRQVVKLTVNASDAQSIVVTSSWSPDGKRIAIGCFDGVRVWNVGEGGHLYTYNGHTQAVRSVSWSPDSRRIASASEDKTVQVWDAADGGHAYTYRGHTGFVKSVSWSPDGKRIASASQDATVQVWDAANGGNVYTYRGHIDQLVFIDSQKGVNTVAWSPDGKHIASGGSDNTVQVWDDPGGGLW